MPLRLFSNQSKKTRLSQIFQQTSLGQVAMKIWCEDPTWKQCLLNALCSEVYETLE